MDFKIMKEKARKKGRGTVEYGNINGQSVWLAPGIRDVFMENNEIQKVIDAVTRFENGDYGDAQSYGKSERQGHEYGRYELASFENSGQEDTGVWVHHAENSIIVYFSFER